MENGIINMTRKRTVYAWKAVFSFVCCMILVFLSSFLNITAAESQDETPTDFIFVLDCSGSMNANDRDGLTARAVEDFLDMLPDHARTRVGVVVFGNDYGNDAFPIGTEDDSKSRVKLAFQLTEMTEESESQIKNCIKSEIARTDKVNLSPVGYALETAAKVLDQSGSKQNNAAILLLSDGQVSGQTDGYNGNKDYDSIDRAVQIAKVSEWPVYCMELNYKQENKKDAKGFPGIAYHQMRENIPAGTGTEPIELKVPEDAKEVFRQILVKFYETNVDIIDLKEGEGQVSVPALTAEEQISLTEKNGSTGAIEKVNGIEFISPTGKNYSFIRKDTKQETDEFFVEFKSDEIFTKIYAPEEGVWTVKVHGTGNADIKGTAVSLREADFNLSSSVTPGEIEAGTTITFKAWYSYNGKKFSSEKFYSVNPAKLRINGADVQMKTEKNEYTATYTFQDKGSYDVYAYVENSIFRNGINQSGHYSFTIENSPLKIGETMKDITVPVNGKSSPIDLKKYFLNLDDDKVDYSAVYDKSTGITVEITDTENMILSGGIKSGAFEIKVTANDGSKTGPVEQSFRLIVENQPVQLIGKDKLDVVLISSDPEKNHFEFVCKDYFSDPDGISPRITVYEDDGRKQFIEYEEKDGVIEFSAVGKGKGIFLVSGVDASDITSVQSVELKITSMSPLMFKIYQGGMVSVVIAVLAAAVLIGLLLVFTGRKLYGRWYIYYDNSISDEERILENTGSGRKASCPLNSLLNDLGYFDTDFGAVKVCAGNRFSKKVSFKNLEGMESVEVDMMPFDKKEVSILPGQSVQISYQGHSVTFTRVS